MEVSELDPRVRLMIKKLVILPSRKIYSKNSYDNFVIVLTEQGQG